MEDVPELEEEEEKEENTLDSLLVENKTYDWFPQGLCDYHYLHFFIFTSTLDILGTEVEQHTD